MELKVTRDVVKQRIERCKTETSRKPVPIDAVIGEVLWAWRLRCAYNQPQDWIFASPAKKASNLIGELDLPGLHQACFGRPEDYSAGRLAHSAA